MGKEGGGVGFQSLNVSGHSDRDILQHNTKAALVQMADAKISAEKYRLYK